MKRRTKKQAEFDFGILQTSAMSAEPRDLYACVLYLRISHGKAVYRSGFRKHLVSGHQVTSDRLREMAGDVPAMFLLDRMVPRGTVVDAGSGWRKLSCPMGHIWELHGRYDLKEAMRGQTCPKCAEKMLTARGQRPRA
jgi:hypothetical protein